LSAFCQEKNFVLCAFFIWGNGTATRYTLFQRQIKNDEVVYYNEKPLSPLTRLVASTLYATCTTSFA